MKTKEKRVNFTFESILDGAFFKIGNIEIIEGINHIELDEEVMVETENTISNQTFITKEKANLSYEEQIRSIGLKPVEYGKYKFIEKVEQQAWEGVLEETVCEIDNIEIKDEKKLVNELCESNDIELKLDANDEIEHVTIESETKDIEETTVDDNIMLTLNIDTVSYKQKPDNDEEVRAIQRRIGSCKTTVSINDFISAIENGRSFKAAALNGSKNIDWESQQVFALDIDNKGEELEKYGMLTPEDAYRRLSALGIPPAFYYESFSSTKETPKFRLVFLVKNPVTDVRVRNVIQMALMNIVPECDRACKDLSRLFFATNKKCVLFDANINVLDPERLINSLQVYIKKVYSRNGNHIREIQNY